MPYAHAHALEVALGAKAVLAQLSLPHSYTLGAALGLVVLPSDWCACASCSRAQAVLLGHHLQGPALFQGAHQPSWDPPLGYRLMGGGLLNAPDVLATGFVQPTQGQVGPTTLCKLHGISPESPATFRQVLNC